jgi:hypothetical protein
MNRALTLLLATTSLAPALHAGEKRIREKQMPAPVLAAFHKAYPAAAIRGLAVETEHGQTTYEIESLDSGIRRDLSYLADGTLAEMEETIPEAALPAPVKAALKAQHPGAKLLKVEKDTKGAAVTYELHVKEGARMREVVLDPDGKAAGGEPGKD